MPVDRLFNRARIRGCAVFAVLLLVPGLVSAQAELVQAKPVLETVGYVVPAQTVVVSPRVAGLVAQTAFEEGQVVKEGDVLARLESTGFELKVRIAEAELRGAQARLEKSSGAAEREKVIGQAAVEAARARVDLARWHLDGTRVRAPVTGTVLVKRAEVGGFVNPKGPAGASALCEIVDLRRLDVEVWVPERDLARVAKGQACVVRLDAFPKTTYRGAVVRLVPVADRAKGAVGVRVRLEVPEKDDQLRPDLRALVQFLGKQ